MGRAGGTAWAPPPSQASSCIPGPPSMQVTIEDVQAQRGSTAQFHAVIEGNPQPMVTWYRVGTGAVWGAGLGDCVAFASDGKTLMRAGQADLQGPQGGLMAAPPFYASRTMPSWWTVPG